MSVLIEEMQEPVAIRRAAEAVLRDLPEWFGIEEALQTYIHRSAELKSLRAVQGHETLGFISIERHNPQSAEIYVMGVKKSSHRQGIGRKLLEAMETILTKEGYRMLLVKTLSASHPDPGYRKSRAFYTANGFIALHEFPELWGKENPCLLMGKPLS
ncbi:GNAT family N-acetyltransferase [Alkalicoccus luteus]|uniref:GNAT family N-acetyltransferase n=1 Tax=Alkalicoccus luteus TaxID=1237094 RepID=A0A969PQN4_9BACI|nr:GNAT family N-acetyltransferase [Alkalicoccus luteus]NJP36183.1 GNAT family N-acetyltransferase [Alkalicoccus luteus]